MKTQALVLAAGKGSRMGGEIPKVLQPFHKKPLIHHILETLDSFEDLETTLILGYCADKVREACVKHSFDVVMQREQLGTGHAVQQAIPLLEASSIENVLVLPGDCPAIRAETLRVLMSFLEAPTVKAALLTAVLDNPSKFGRVLKDNKGNVMGIKEFKDCTVLEREINEINSGIYIFRKQPFLTALKTLDNKNVQGEFYLTDVIADFYQKGYGIKSLEAANVEEVMGVNTREELEALEKFHKNKS